MRNTGSGKPWASRPSLVKDEYLAILIQNFLIVHFLHFYSNCCPLPCCSGSDKDISLHLLTQSHKTFHEYVNNLETELSTPQFNGCGSGSEFHTIDEQCVPGRKLNRSYRKPKLDASPTHSTNSSEEKKEDNLADSASDCSSKSNSHFSKFFKCKSPQPLPPFKSPVPIKAEVLTQPPRRSADSSDSAGPSYNGGYTAKPKQSNEFSYDAGPSSAFKLIKTAHFSEKDSAPLVQPATTTKFDGSARTFKPLPDSAVRSKTAAPKGNGVKDPGTKTTNTTKTEPPNNNNTPLNTKPQKPCKSPISPVYRSSGTTSGSSTCRNIRDTFKATKLRADNPKQYTCKRPKRPPDKNNGNHEDQNKDDKTNNVQKASIRLVKNYSQESEEDLPGVVTRQPTNQSILRRQSTTSDPTYPTDTKSNDPITSTDSESHTADLKFYTSGSAEFCTTKKKWLLTSIPTPEPDTKLADEPVYSKETHEEQPRRRREKASNVVDLHYDLCHSTPVASGHSIRHRRRDNAPSIYETSERKAEYPHSLSANYDAPPSPAPPTPVKHRQLSLYKQPIYESFWSQESRPWTFEEFEKLSYGHRKRTHTGPRHVVFVGVEDSDEEVEQYQNFRLQDEAAALPEPNFRASFYGAESPSQPFRSYLGPETNKGTAQQSKTAISDVKNKRKDNNTLDNPESPMGRMNPLEEQDRKVIIEFCHLLEKSKQLFNGLRELPQYGHKQWSLYFGRTFDIYTRLWKYQQQHRAVLDSKYGMKRWQIGEIASKIGQLYYHFYLRTSETAYLNEAFSFYYAIRGRCYYTKANKEDKCELMVKKLRYYARFIVVCLLLNKMKLVKELIKELERQIIEYGNTYDPDDQVEWTVVVDEVKAFIHAEPVVSIVNTDNQTMLMSHRLSPIITPPVERTPQMTLSLQEIVIVGSSSQQVKFSELTMDMFRMMQTLEREPSGDIQHIFDESPRQRFMSTPNVRSQGVSDGLDGSKQPNPHKYLLFKPSPSQVLVYLASGCDDLPPNGALLLYISADGHVPQPPKHAEDGYELGGLITTSKTDIYRECNKDPKSSSSSSTKHKELQCVYPGDLYPFTRRPLFVVVDSDNSYAFQNIPRHFGQPLVILMSPLDMPPSYHDPRRQGSLFTLFLHAPLEGLCYSCDLSSITLALWERTQLLIDTFMAEASTIIVRSRLVDPTYISFMGDDFLRLLITRYIFCEATLRMHRLFRGRTHRTRCSPPLPDELFEHPTLVHIIMDIANALQIRNHIQDPAMVNRDREGASGGN